MHPVDGCLVDLGSPHPPPPPGCLIFLIPVFVKHNTKHRKAEEVIPDGIKGTPMIFKEKYLDYIVSKKKNPFSNFCNVIWELPNRKEPYVVHCNFEVNSR